MTTVGKDGTVEFWFYRKGVRRVRVVGDFAAWPGGVSEMSSIGDGWWRLVARLDAGEYRFRYAADGEWYADYASNGIEPGEAGVQSVLTVPDRGAHTPRTAATRMVA
jgi:1,4-alpha-glucan branching enzyme